MVILKKTKKRIFEIHPEIEKLKYTLVDLEYATPKEIADWRANRLSCNKIADVGCGIGFQSFAFANTCKKVYAIEKNRRKIELAKRNAEILGIKNVEFIHGDVLDESIVARLKGIDILFCDTERLPSEKARSIQTIEPNINKLIDIYSKITDKIALELPPQIREIPFDCEREYVYFKGRLRLTTYLMKLKTCERSAVILPQRNVLKSSSKPVEIFLLEGGNPGRYLYEINDAVVKASLLNELNMLIEEASPFYKNKFCLFTSDILLESPFFKNRFEVKSVCKNDFESIIKNLVDANAGKVILRGAIEPAQYWKERKKYEEKVNGEDVVHLFILDKAIICKKI